MHRRHFLAGFGLACACSSAAPPAQGNWAASASDTSLPLGVIDKPVTGVVENARLFRLDQITLLDGPFYEQREKNRLYLLKLDPDRLLSAFRREADLDPKAPPYRGWESEGMPLWGHILGFFLSGAGYMVQTTHDTELTARLNYITDELHIIQTANKSGYLTAVPGGKKLFADIAAGQFEITNADEKYGYQINDVFEPTYTWNKITLGLYQSYKATGNIRTRDVLIRTADWFGHDVLDHLSHDQTQKLLFCEHGSIHESMLIVYELTGDEKYLRWARKLCFERLLHPLAEGNGSFLDGHHANCSIPVYTGFERVYQRNGEEILHRASVNFLDEVITNRSWVLGGNSAEERFFPVVDFEKSLQVVTGPETCNSVNMLRLVEAVYSTHSDPKYLDHYERTLWNHLLSAHDPDRCMTAYYTPMQPGSYRVYGDEFDSMWCCVGTGLECPGKYGQMIYTHGPANDRVDVNLFIASKLDWAEEGFQLQQTTRFPEQASTTIDILKAPSKHVALRVRHPWWIPAGQMQIRLNGKVVPTQSRPGEFAELKRKWRKGDRLQISLPLNVSTAMLPHSSSYIAIMYGPILLSGVLGREGLTKFDFWGLTGMRADKVAPENNFPAILVPSHELANAVQPIPGENLKFRLKTGTATSNDVTLIPFYRNHFQRYAVYWKLGKYT